MAWETALDRLVLSQIHAAEKGDLRPKDVEQLIRDLHGLAPSRPTTAFHMGYATALLGLDLPADQSDPAQRRWHLFGRVRGHDRCGERNWVADLLQNTSAVMELLQDAAIARQCLPLVLRTLFWCEDLALAVRALEFLATEAQTEESQMLVDAGLSDLLSRLEVREDRDNEEFEPTASILEKCIGLPCFDRLPDDVRARYHHALGARRLAASEFEAARAPLQRAIELATRHPRVESAARGLLALSELRVHETLELEPRAERAERAAALEILDGHDEAETTVPEALFVLGVLSYETGDFQRAQRCCDRALADLRRVNGRDVQLIDRTRFFLAASILAAGNTGESSRALRLMDAALEQNRPDLESFYPVHEALKTLDRGVALKFLDRVDIGRGTAPDQLLFIALEYVGLGEAEPAARAADRVLQVAVNLDQRIEAMRVLLTACNMRGDRGAAREVFFSMRDLLMQRGAFQELENLLENEEAVGQALDHLEVKCELVALYEEMEDKDLDRAMLKTAIARSLRARKDVDALREAHGLLKEVEIRFPELATDELGVLEKLLSLSDAAPADTDAGARAVESFRQQHGRAPRVLVVGGNERQRRHHPRFEELGGNWQFEGEWLMANYSSPQKAVNAINDRLKTGVDALVLLHWNRHETTEPALELARRAGIAARTVHYAGFTSLQVCLTDMLERLGRAEAPAKGNAGKGKAGAKG